jgi:hypothetical protein
MLSSPEYFASNISTVPEANEYFTMVDNYLEDHKAKYDKVISKWMLFLDKLPSEKTKLIRGSYEESSKVLSSTHLLQEFSNNCWQIIQNAYQRHTPLLEGNTTILHQMNCLISGYSSIESLATFKEEFESIISEAKSKSVSTMPPLTKCLEVLPPEKPRISNKRKSSSVTSDDDNSIKTKHKKFKPSPQVQSKILGDVTNKQSTSTKHNSAQLVPIQSTSPKHAKKNCLQTSKQVSKKRSPSKYTIRSAKKMLADYRAKQEEMPCRNNYKATGVAHAGPESRATLQAQQAQVNQQTFAGTSKVAVEQNDLNVGVSGEEPDLDFGASNDAEMAPPAMDDAVGDLTHATIEVNDETAANTAKKSQPVIKFGTNSAVSFDKLQPTTEWTPLPPHVVEELFPSDGKKETAEEQDVSRETKQNVAILAEWDTFDESEQSMKRKRGRNCSPSNSRRDSAFFSKEQFDLDSGVSNEEPDLDFGVSNDDASNDVEAEPTAAAAEVDFGGTDNVGAPEETAGVEAAVEVDAPPVVQPRVRVRVPRRGVRRVRMIRVSIMKYCITNQRSFACTHKHILFGVILSM